MRHSQSLDYQSRRLERTVWVLILARAVNRLGAFTLPFLAVLLVSEFDVTSTGAGYLLAGFGVASISSRLVGGKLADHVGAKPTILIGLVGTALAQLALAGAQSLPHATLAVIALGLAFEIYEPPSQSMIADVTPPELRPKAYGLLATAMAVAGLGAGLLAALLAGFDLRWLFVADATTGLVCAVVVGVFLPPRQPTPKATEAGNPWTDPGSLKMLMIGTCFAIVYLQLIITLPLTLTARGHDPALLGLLLTLSAAVTVLGQVILARRKIDDFTAMAYGFAVLGAGLALNGVVTSLVGFAIATVLWSIGDLILLGRAYTIVAAIAPKHARGRYLAAYGVSWGIAGILAPLIGTQLLAYGGPRLLWSSAAVTCIVLATGQPKLRRSVDAAPAD